MFSFFRADDGAGTSEILFEEISDKSNIWTRIDFPLDIKDKNYQVVMSGQYTRMETMPFGKFSLSEKNGILLPKLFWPTHSDSDGPIVSNKSDLAIFDFLIFY